MMNIVMNQEQFEQLLSMLIGMSMMSAVVGALAFSLTVQVGEDVKLLIKKRRNKKRKEIVGETL